MLFCECQIIFTFLISVNKGIMFSNHISEIFSESEFTRITLEQRYIMGLSSPKTLHSSQRRSDLLVRLHRPVSIGSECDPKRNWMMSLHIGWMLLRNGDVCSSGFMSVYILYLYRPCWARWRITFFKFSELSLYISLTESYFLKRFT